MLISGQSLSRGQTSLNQQISTILKGRNIPYEEMDGSILNVRDRRNELFKISGLWAEYPQFFIRENGHTIFWGTWDTLQQCNDAGKIEEEFAPERVRLQRTSTMTANGVASSIVAPAAHESEEDIPPLSKRKSSEPDDNDERSSIASPNRMPQPLLFNKNNLRKAAVRALPDSLDKKKFLSRKHMGSIHQKIDEDSVLEGSSVNVEHSANVSLTDDSQTDTTTAMDESVTAQTVGESVATASTAPRLGAKSLDSLERKDLRAQKDKATGNGDPDQGVKYV